MLENPKSPSKTCSSNHQTNSDDTQHISSCSASSSCSFNSSLNRKRALSDVISKLRNNQQTDNKDHDSLSKLEEENGNETESYETNQNDSDLNDEDEEFNYQNESNLQGTINNENSSQNSLENYHQMSANEQISAIMTAVATQNLSPSQSRPFTNNFYSNQKPQQQQQRSVNGINNQNKQLNKPVGIDKKIINEKSNKNNDLLLKPVANKSEIDLLKLLARANLTQYLTIFTEQGIYLRYFKKVKLS